jgi:hypothetical protein
MSEKARSEMRKKDLEVVSDRGYYKGTEIVACEDAGITAFVPKPLTSRSKKKGLFSKISRAWRFTSPENDPRNFLTRHKLSL